MKIETEQITTTTFNGKPVRKIVEYDGVVIWATPDRTTLFLTNHTLDVLCEIYCGKDEHDEIKISDLEHMRGAL